MPMMFVFLDKQPSMRFWWGYKQDKARNLSLHSWDKICTPRPLGGIGIRLMCDTNMALISKMGWMISLFGNRSCVNLLQAKYLKRTDFL
ncbi:hypothetical protein CJ030_MR4G005810 [Morella rubra]|uniref:Uncharacterized protein n=1 Tax=Morella rubra TaxID=262757 RepID=A0A6A1VTI6_9ROSI|nr:hypothetical protein CJ030_MR4G005810 [Morella rubra]